jgi:hypothetical protein
MRGVRNGSLILTEAERGIMEQKEIREHVLSLIYTSKPELQAI